MSRRCKAAWKKWKKVGRPSQGPEHEEKKRLSRLTKQCANKCRANIDRKSWEKRERMFMTRDPRCFKTPPNQPSLGDKITHDGKVTSDPTTVLTCWTNHFKDLFRSQLGTNSSIDEAENEMPRLDALSRLNVDDIIDDEFTVEEVETCLKRLKCNKACGIDGLQPEHLKYGGQLLTLWLKQIFCAFSQFEQVPPSLLTGVICPIYKGRGKDPLSCHSYRGITLTSVLMKVFEYAILNRLQPVLQENGHPSLTQTAYQKHISCQDAIFATQEAIQSNLRDKRATYLSLYDLEMAFDSVEHCILLQSLFHAGKAWRLIRACYSNLTAVLKLRSTLSDLFPITRGVQQGSVLSPIFFLVVMDRLLQRLRETSSGMSICGLYLGGADADDVRVLASSAAVAEEQGKIIHSFATENGLKLNCEKTEVVKISQSNHHVNNPLLLADHIVEVIPHAVCLGYHWSHCLSARRGVEININKARRFFTLDPQAASLDTPILYRPGK